MPSVCAFPFRHAVIALLASGALTASVAPASAQGFGVGARVAWVNADSEADVDAARFFGGQVRLVGGRYGLELSLDRHTETFDALNQKVTETPVQASLIMRMASGRIAPFLLG